MRPCDGNAPGCRRLVKPGSFVCPCCWRKIPASIRSDLEACIRRGWAFSPLNPLWRTAAAAALDALARTEVACVTNHRTAHRHRRRAA